MTNSTCENREVADQLTAAVGSIIVRFDAMSVARDIAISEGRQVIRLAANAIRALHRGEDASDLLAKARVMMDSIVEKTQPDPNIFASRDVQDSMKEFPQARIT